MRILVIGPLIRREWDRQNDIYLLVNYARNLMEKKGKIVDIIIIIIIIIFIFKVLGYGRFPWLSLAIRPNRPPLLVIPLDGIQCLLKADYVSFWWSASTGISNCWSPLENVAYEFVLTLLVLLGCFLRWEVSGRKAAIVYVPLYTVVKRDNTWTMVINCGIKIFVYFADKRIFWS